MSVYLFDGSLNQRRVPSSCQTPWYPLSCRVKCEEKHRLWVVLDDSRYDCIVLRKIFSLGDCPNARHASHHQPSEGTTVLSRGSTRFLRGNGSLSDLRCTFLGLTELGSKWDASNPLRHIHGHCWNRSTKVHRGGTTASPFACSKYVSAVLNVGSLRSRVESMMRHFRV